MQQNISEMEKLSIYENFIKNINNLLKGKSIKEINDIFDLQDKNVNSIEDNKLRKIFLNNLKDLRKIAIKNAKLFDSIIERLKNSMEKIPGKSREDINNFFNKINLDISKIPDQRMRQVLLLQSKKVKDIVLEDFNNI